MKNFGRYSWLVLLAVASLSAAEPKKAIEQKHCLWKIAGKTNTVYLLGSVHILSQSNYPLAKPIESAYSNSSSLVFEADLAEMDDLNNGLKLLSKGSLPEGKTLESELSPDTYKLFTNHVLEAGLPLFMLGRLAPGVAATFLEGFQILKLGTDLNLGIEKHFYTRAKDDAKEVTGLETAEFQMSLLTGLSKEEGELMMKTTLEKLGTIKKDFADVVSAWEAGDTAKVEKVLNETVEEAPAIYKRLITDRNERWVPKIEELLKADKSALVIVGAGHLVGKQGVVELLRKKGWKVTQL